MDLIIYHNACPDGFCAAMVARMRYPEAEILGLNHGEEGILHRLIPMVVGKDVLMVDFSLRTRGENIQLHSIAKSFHIFDHHKTAEAELEGLPFATFDMARSGAGITWDELFGKYDKKFYDSGVEIRIGGNRRNYVGMPETQRPWYVDYVEDRDLWNHRLPRTKEINAFIMTLPFTVDAWRNLAEMSGSQAADLGVGALAHVDHYVREIVKHHKIGRYNVSDDLSYSVAILNAPYLNCSEVGNVLSSEYADIGMTWFERGDGIIQFSLRSTGDKDVSVIAKAYNGGGHKNAAGFQMSLENGRRLIDGLLLR